MEHPDIAGLSDWRPLARGGFAVVWEARQLALDRLVAVKVYQGDLDEGGRLRFLREAAAAGRLSDHPGIVTAYDAGTLPDDRPYLVMELCPGGSLTRWLDPENRPSEERVRQVGIQIADALAAVHARGVLHRDIKPANILIGSFGNAALADFGLAAVAGAETGPADALLVTPAYAPPEAFALQPATHAGDVFSLAATLYALLKGSPLRQVGAAPVALEQWAAVAETPVEPIAGVNWHLMGVLMTALSDDTAARPDAAAFRDELAQVPSNASAQRRAVTRDGQHAPAEKVSLQTSRRSGGARWAIVALAAAAAVAVVASVAVTVRVAGGPAVTDVPPLVRDSATPSQSSSSSAGSPIRRSATPTVAATPSARQSGPSRSATEANIELREVAGAAKPFQSVRIEGAFRGRPDTFLQVARREGDKWLAFPLPTKTDKSGRFTAYVELGQPGLYRLRIVDPKSGVKSRPFKLLIQD